MQIIPTAFNVLADDGKPAAYIEKDYRGWVVKGARRITIRRRDGCEITPEIRFPDDTSLFTVKEKAREVARLVVKAEAARHNAEGQVERARRMLTQAVGA